MHDTIHGDATARRRAQANIVYDTIEELDEHGWHQGAYASDYYDDEAKRNACKCVIGAMTFVTTGHVGRHNDLTRTVRDKFRLVYGIKMADYNDARGRTYETLRERLVNFATHLAGEQAATEPEPEQQ